MSLSSQLKTLNWRWILSISQVVLALALFLMLRAELKVHDAGFEAARAQSRAQGWDLRMEFDYVPHAFVWMVVFDFPAIVAVALFGIGHVSRIGPLFVALVGLFWFWVGRGLEKRLKGIDRIRKRPGIVASILNGVGLLCAFALLFYVLLAGAGASGLILYGSVVAWSTAFVVYFGTRLTRYWRNKGLPSSPV